MSDTTEFEKELMRRIEKVGIHLVNAIRRNINTSQGRVKTGTTYHGEDPSAPGEPPHKLTGDLQRSIAYQITKDGFGVSVGSALPYAPFLEFGTVHMEPRPFIRSTLIAEKDKIESLLAGK